MRWKEIEDDPFYRLGQAISILEGILGMKKDPTVRRIPKKIWMDLGRKFVLEERGRLAHAPSTS